MKYIDEMDPECFHLSASTQSTTSVQASLFRENPNIIFGLGKYMRIIGQLNLYMRISNNKSCAYLSLLWFGNNMNRQL